MAAWLALLLCLANVLPRTVSSAAPGAGALDIDLTASTFNATLLALPRAAHVLMEFYARWGAQAVCCLGGICAALKDIRLSTMHGLNA